MKKFRPENRRFLLIAKLRKRRFSGIWYVRRFCAHVCFLTSCAVPFESNLENYCTSGRVSFLLREFTADGCLPSTDALKRQKFYSSLPTFIPTASFKNSVFHKISISFACPLALLPSSVCGVKSEIRPDVNKKLSNGLQMRCVKALFSPLRINLRRTKMKTATFYSYLPKRYTANDAHTERVRRFIYSFKRGDRHAVDFAINIVSECLNNGTAQAIKTMCSCVFLRLQVPSITAALSVSLRR